MINYLSIIRKSKYAEIHVINTRKKTYLFKINLGDIKLIPKKPDNTYYCPLIFKGNLIFKINNITYNFKKIIMKKQIESFYNKNVIHKDNIYVVPKNGDKFDYRRSNLLVCGPKTTTRNRVASRSSTSKYIGVSVQDKQRNIFTSRISIDTTTRFDFNNKYIDIKSEEKAAAIYDFASYNLGFNSLNIKQFPELKKNKNYFLTEKEKEIILNKIFGF